MEKTRRKKIGVDIDETLNNLMSRILDEYNLKYQDEVKVEDILAYNVGQFLSPECQNIFAEFCNDQLLLSLSIEKEAIKILTKLSEITDIYFVTAGHPVTAPGRDLWLSEHFSFYKSNMLIMCQHKAMLDLDYLIDDYNGNMEGSSYIGLLVTKPWNKDIDVDNKKIVRVNNWDEIIKYFEGTEWFGKEFRIKENS